MFPYGALEPKPGPKQWDGTIEDYNPDHHPSFSKRFIIEQDGSIYMILAVKYLGAIIFRCSADGDEFHGVSTFNEHEIHTGVLE